MAKESNWKISGKRPPIYGSKFRRARLNRLLTACSVWTADVRAWKKDVLAWSSAILAFTRSFSRMERSSWCWTWPRSSWFSRSSFSFLSCQKVSSANKFDNLSFSSTSGPGCYEKLLSRKTELMLEMKFLSFSDLIGSLKPSQPRIHFKNFKAGGKADCFYILGWR